MGEKLVFNNRHNYIIGKQYFQKDKNPINIKDADTEKMVLFNETPNGEYGANKYYIVYLSGGFKPVHIIIKDIKLYTHHTNHINVLANDSKLLKYIEIWNKIESLFYKKINKKGFYSKRNNNINTYIIIYNNIYIIIYIYNNI